MRLYMTVAIPPVVRVDEAVTTESIARPRGSQLSIFLQGKNYRFRAIQIS